METIVLEITGAAGFGRDLGRDWSDDRGLVMSIDSTNGLE